MLKERTIYDIQVSVEKVQSIEAVIFQIKNGNLQLNQKSYEEMELRLRDIVDRLSDLLIDLKHHSD